MHQEIETLFDLKGRIALITGGAVHFGFDIASVLGAAGCHLAITSRDLARAEESADYLRKTYDVEVLALELDVANAKAVTRVVARVHEWKSRIDILINNAGGGSGRGPCHLFERATEDLDRLIAVNQRFVVARRASFWRERLRVPASPPRNEMTSAPCLPSVIR